MSVRKQTIVISIVFAITVLFWILFNVLTGYTALYEGPIYQFALKPLLIGMMLLPLLGGIFGLIKAKGWGGSRSTMGKAMIGLSLGLLAWSGGMIIWNYYLFFTEIEVPYPSIADAIFILSWPFWTYGVVNLSRVAGAGFALREKLGKSLLFVVPLVAATLSYYLLFVVARGGLFEWNVSGLQLFFDLFYPIGDLVILSVVTLVFFLSRRFLGGKYKIPIFIILLGFIANYASDFVFSYTTTVETYFNGHLVDLMFTITMFILSLGIVRLDVGEGSVSEE